MNVAIGHISNKSSGMVLIISLIFLLLLCILSLSAMQSANIQEKMAGNIRDHQLAFQAAEAALRSGEGFLLTASVTQFDGSNGLYDSTISGNVNWMSNTTTWQQRPSLAYTARAAQYFIEKLPADVQEPETLVAGEPVPDVQLYRVTAQGFGSTNISQVVLQSIYRK